MKNKRPQTYQIAQFALRKKYKDLSPEIIDQLKKHLLDSIASLIHCVNSPTIQKLKKKIDFLSDGGKIIVPSKAKLPLDRAAEFYTALIRYPDFMDNFLGKEATCHPSDNIGSLLAAAQINNSSGKEFLLAMAIGYEIECRLIEEIPVMMKGFDHTLLLAYSIAAELCSFLKLDEEQTANALSIAGCSFNPLVTCRASYTREWKGLLSSIVALGSFNAVLSAKEGITGPTDIFEGPKGFEKEFGMALDFDWTKDQFNLIPKCVLKSYNAEVHTQSLIEATIELKEKYKIDYKKVDRIVATTFLTAYHIVGGGEYGDRIKVFSKEQGDHSIPYVLSVALIDGEVYPDQFLPKRINKADVQKLMKKVEVNTKFPLHKPLKVAGILDPYTKVYPEKLMGEVKIVLKDGKEYSLEKEDYYGFYTRPMSWDDVKNKFYKLTDKIIGVRLQQKIIDAITNFENIDVKTFIKLLA
ncbi:MAG TPA: MmgE/PrpD family protein [Flavisolibacter sp.]|nr:MmgE/PrpD family protein [Flavisolibacter sp.]